LTGKAVRIVPPASVDAVQCRNAIGAAAMTAALGTGAVYLSAGAIEEAAAGLAEGDVAGWGSVGRALTAFWVGTLQPKMMALGMGMTIWHDQLAGTAPTDPRAILNQAASEGADQLAHWYNPFYGITDDIRNAHEQCTQ
jgi:hypothetical protein